MSNSPIAKKIPSELKRNWGWLLGLGIIFVLLGTIGLGMVVGITLVSMLFFGMLLIVAGISQIADVFKSKSWNAVSWHALIAVLYIIAGGIVIYDPFLASVVITAFLGGILVLIGVARLVMGLSLRDTQGWVWLVLGGLVTLILGLLILIQWPWSGLWVIGLFIAIEMLVNGWTYIFLAFAMKEK